jgi:hypothetical protein
MIEKALLDAFVAQLSDLSLTPAPALVGVIEPAASADLPALVVAIEHSERLGGGLGERSALVRIGALAWEQRVDLASPLLPGSPEVRLVSDDGRQLSLAYGGLVRKTGVHGPLGAADFTLTIDGAPLTLVASNPGADQFSVEPIAGVLSFGAPLPPSGSLVCGFFLGQWEQRVARGSGRLRLSVFAGSAAVARDLSDAALLALGRSRAPFAGASRFDVAEIGSVAAVPTLAGASVRVARFRFEFEQQINEPESTGGIIQRIPVQALLG